MPIPIECPLCGHKGAVPDKFDGKQVKCPECCNLFFASPTGEAVPSSSKTGSSHAGNMKIGSAGNQVRRPASPTMPGTQKLPTGGSQFGNMKISVPGGSHQGNAKKPGSHAGNQKSPTAGSQFGTLKPSAGSHAGTAKAPVKPGGSQQGVMKKPGSAAGTQKKPPAKPAASARDPWSNLSYADGPTDDASVGKNYRKRRQRRMLTNLFVLFFLFGFLGLIGLGGAFTYSHIQGGGNIQDLFAKLAPKKATEDKTGTETKPDDDPPFPKDTKPAAPEGPLLFDPSKGPARIGDVAIHLVSVNYAVPAGKDIEAKDKLLLVSLKVENTGTKPVDFQGWGCVELINEKHPPVAMVDDQNFKRVTFGAGKLVNGQILAATIDPGQSVSDVVAFEPPPGGIPFLKVELSSENFGGKEGDKFVLLISSTVLTKGGLPKPDPKIDPKGDPKPVELKELAVVAQYRALLKNPKQAVPVKKEAIAVLTELGPAASTAIPDLLPVLQKDTDETIRLAAAECLNKFGPRAKDAIPALIERVQKDDFWKVRAECANTLAKIGPDAKDSLVALNEQVAKEKDEMALKAIQDAIKRLGGN